MRARVRACVRVRVRVRVRVCVCVCVRARTQLLPRHMDIPGRDQTCAIEATRATAVTMPGP